MFKFKVILKHASYLEKLNFNSVLLKVMVYGKSPMLHSVQTKSLQMRKKRKTMKPLHEQPTTGSALTCTSEKSQRCCVIAFSLSCISDSYQYNHGENVPERHENDLYTSTNAVSHGRARANHNTASPRLNTHTL